MAGAQRKMLIQIYKRLYDAFGPQQWWPAETRFEVMVGAVLTQNTNWGNVEKALTNLKREKLLSPAVLHQTPRKKLARLIKPAGYFNIKADRLKHLTDFLCGQYDGNLKRLARQDTARLRRQLLRVKGIGPETADSILLYALDKPVFVVDAYTKRILFRHNLIEDGADYHAIQETFTNGLQRDLTVFNEYHALIVRVGKEFCKPTPRCEACPLNTTHYSLKHRCPSCYRALTPLERKEGVSQRACQACLKVVRK